MSILSQDQMNSVRKARWEAWRRLAKQLPDHHILAVELLRVDNDETAAVFTVVRNSGVVQHVVRGDERGRVKPPGKDPAGIPDKLRKPALDHLPDHLDPRRGRAPDDDCGPGVQRAGFAAAALSAGLRPSEEAVDANAIALGEPPPKDPPPPGITSLASVLLASAFDVGEQLAGK